MTDSQYPSATLMVQATALVSQLSDEACIHTERFAKRAARVAPESVSHARSAEWSIRSDNIELRAVSLHSIKAQISSTNTNGFVDPWKTSFEFSYRVRIRTVSWQLEVLEFQITWQHSICFFRRFRDSYLLPLHAYFIYELIRHPYPRALLSWFRSIQLLK